MNPNQQQQQQQQGAAGNGQHGAAGGSYARQMMHAQQAAMRQVQQAQQHQPQQQQQQQQQQGQGGLAPGMLPQTAQPQPPAPGQHTPGGATQPGSVPAPGLDANALATIQSAIQGAVNDPVRMQNLLTTLVASGRINPTQLAQIRAMLARNSQNANLIAQRPAVSVQQQQHQQGLAPPPQVMAPPQQAPQSSNAAVAMQSAAAPQSVATPPTPAARLAQIESELRNEAAVNSEANAAADHVTQRLAELDRSLGTLQPGTDAHNRISEQRVEEQGKLAHVGSRFMEAKKYYDDLREQQKVLRLALGRQVVGNPAVAGAAVSVRAGNGSPAPGGGGTASPAPNAGEAQSGALNAATNAALAPSAGTASGSAVVGISPSKVDLSSAGPPGINPASLAMGTGQQTTTTAVTGTANAAALVSGEPGSNQGNRPMIPTPQTGNRIEVTAPSVTGEPFPASRGPRPTLNQGLAAPNPVTATPATLSRPSMNSATGLGASGSGSGVSMGGGTGGGGAGGSSSSYISAGASSFGPGSLATTQENRLLNKRKLQELVGEIDAGEQLEGDVEDLLLEIADEFIESVTHFACKLAKHRRGEKLEVKDVQLHLGESLWKLPTREPGKETFCVY
ncbi:hypothetical protein CF336_g8961 [Tilletia laevis]|nr:hypothetical protein CF336_g8961 [Tilletia laevis]KAE8182194.1 hypothetical protein CF335_g8709 [Tilletia laevis]KAE8182282.1 hypothetical protein CF328_g8564 [Tilletia controversa]